MGNNVAGVTVPKWKKFKGEKVSVTPIVEGGRQPTTTDTDYNLGTLWLVGVNPTTGTEGELFRLTKFSSGDAIWEEVGAGAASPLTTKGDIYTYDTADARLGVGADGLVLTADSAETTGLKWSAVAGTGDVVGPGSATDNAITRFDGVTGKLVQNSTATLSDTGDISANSASLTTALTVANGGTGVATITGLLAGNGTSALNGRTITGTTDFVDVADGNGATANPTISIGANFMETGMHGWNGSILEDPAVTVTSNGTVITCSIEQDGGGDLTCVFSDGYYDWDTTPADTVTLTAGSDTSPQINYVYFLQSTKTLTNSTSSFPAGEHVPIATVLCQSAASLQTDGAYKVHQWTDHVVDGSEQGHIGHLNAWIRSQPATYVSGVAQTFTITPGAPDSVILTTASGVVLQLHEHTFPAFAGTPDIYVVNDSTTPYTVVTDLSSITTDSTGASLTGRYYSLVIWGCVSEDTGDCKLFCNLPSGSYNSSAGVTVDADSYANFSIPSDFTGTGFLIAQWNLRNQSDTTFTSIDEIDLRGLFPAVNAGGGASGQTEFADNTFRILDDSDSSKELAFQCSGITTATTRTITMNDADVSLVPNTGTYAAAAGGTQITTLGTITSGTWTGTTIAVANGGTGATTLTDGGILLGSGTSAVTATSQPTNGQLLIGSTGVDPVLATLTGTANEITVTDGAGSVTLSLPAEINLGGKTSLEIPNSATPTVNVDGEIAVDTTVTDFSAGVFKYYSGEEMGVVAMPIAQFTTPTDGHVVAYNATNDEFELVAGGGGGSMPDINVGMSAAQMQVNTTTAFAPITYRDFGSLEINVRAFDDTGPEYAQGFFRVPDDIDTSGTVTFEIIGSAATAAASKNVKFSFDFIEAADSGLLSGAYGTAEVWDDQAVSATTDDQDIISNTETVTNLAWTAGNMVYWRLYRSAATTNNLTGDYHVMQLNILIPQA